MLDAEAEAARKAAEMTRQQLEQARLRQEREEREREEERAVVARCDSHTRHPSADYQV